MSAFSISGVATSGSSAQAPAQPGAPNAATDPFAMLLAAIADADPALQVAAQPDAALVQPDSTPALADAAQLQSAAIPAPVDAAQLQPDSTPAPVAATQAQPPSDRQGFMSPGAQAANDDDDDTGRAMETTDPATTPAVASASSSVPDPGEVAAAKSGKPDKTADAEKPDADDAANLLSMLAQIPFITLPPNLQPVARAAGQAQIVADNDNAGGIPVTPIPDADVAAKTSSPAEPAAPGVKAAMPDPAEPQPASSLDAAKDAAPQLRAQTAANDDSDSGDDATVTDMAGVNQAAPEPHARGAKFAELRSTSSKPASQIPPQPQPAVDDADLDAGPAQNSAVSAPSESGASTPQPILDSAASAPSPQQAAQKPDTDSSNKPAPDKVAAQTNVIAAANANDPAQSVMPAPSVTANNNSNNKPIHAATSAAPQPQADTSLPPPPAATAPMPQAMAVITPSGAPAASGGPTLSLHVMDHTPGSQPTSPSTVAPNMDALAVSVAARSLSGTKQFDIRLDPPELGRVEVRLSIDASGKTEAHMTTDQPQTLELLQKDAPNLTRALRDAGLDVSQNGLNFSLKGQGQNSGGQNGHFGNSSRSLIVPAMAQGIEPAQPAGALSILSGNARLDIHV